MKAIYMTLVIAPGERVAYSVGANFTPHVITVNAGEVLTIVIHYY